jgi:hypothetical protein
VGACKQTQITPNKELQKLEFKLGNKTQRTPKKKELKKLLPD